jgi:hypothetical protein
MAVHDPKGTARWWLVYNNNSTEHRMLMRTANAATNILVSGFFSSFLGMLSTHLNSTTVLGLEHAIQGSNVRNPATYTGTVSFGLGTEASSDTRPRCWSFTGRSADGVKTKVFLFGTKTMGEGDLRVDTSESVDVANAVNFLNTTVGAFLGITGLQPIWHIYTNVGYNDHWTKEYRKIGG